VWGVNKKREGEVTVNEVRLEAKVKLNKGVNKGNCP